MPSVESSEGYLYVILRGEDFDNIDALIQQSYFLRLTGGAVTVSLVLGLLLGLFLFRLLTRRVERLGRTMDAFRESDFTTLVHYGSDEDPHAADEIDRLERTFHAMARRITDQIQALTGQGNTEAFHAAPPFFVVFSMHIGHGTPIVRVRHL